MLKLADTVRALIDVPVDGVRAGWIGAVVHVHETPETAYEVEFVGADGRTVAVTTLKAQQLELVDAAQSATAAPLRCRCCGEPTLSERDAYEICEACGWEDDPVQSRAPAFSGGANKISLNEARSVLVAQPKAR